MRAVHVGVYDNAKVISVLTQMKTVADLGRVLDLKGELASEEILTVYNQYLYKTHVVYTGIDLNEITNLDSRNATYIADFYLWFRYQSPFDPRHIQFLNAVGTVELGEPIAENVTKRVTYKAYRVKGMFRGDFDFRAYPFDQQHLVIQFRHRSLARDRLIYVRDELGMRETGPDVVLARLQRSRAFAALQNWRVNAIHIFQDVLTNNSTLGNPQFFDADALITYSSFHVDRTASPSIATGRSTARHGVSRPECLKSSSLSFSQSLPIPQKSNFSLKASAHRRGIFLSLLENHLS